MMTAVRYGYVAEAMKTRGSPNCRCAHDPNARHGPYYEWDHIDAGKLVHRLVSPEQAQLLRGAIANYRKLKKLLRACESETGRLIDATGPRSPSTAVSSRRNYPEILSAMCGK